MARIHKKEVYQFVNGLKSAKTFGQFMNTLTIFGARNIGEGTSRRAWVWGNYIVKASVWDYDEDKPDQIMVPNLENKSEVKTYIKSNRLLKKLMARVYSDLSAKDGRFIVMEYVPSEDFCYEDIEKYQAKANKISKRKRADLPYCIVHDAHDGNFRKRSNGRLVMIDLQEDW